MTTLLFETAFPAVLNMSLTAIPVILTVLLARLVLRRAPKLFSYVLWAVVLFRLLCPVSVTAPFSLLGALGAPVQEMTENTAAVRFVDPARPVSPVPVHQEIEHTSPQIPAKTAPAAPLQTERPDVGGLLGALPWVWLAGMGAVLAYGLGSLLRLRRRLVGACHLRENIYLSDYAETAFVMGLLRPRIYLPSSLSAGEERYILLHEQHHIRRGDPLWKLLAFLTLAVHWFNPLVWLSVILASQDMEMSCDEAVMGKLGDGIRADYSQSLLELAAGQRRIGVPLAFGEGDTRSRIVNVLRWKRPRSWVVAAAAVGCAAVVAACGVNPGGTATNNEDLTGQYASAEAYVEHVMGEVKGSSISYHTMDFSMVQTVVQDVRLYEQTREGELEDLAPEGVLEAWRYHYLVKIDVPADEVMLPGGMFEEDGWFDLEGMGGHVLVTLRYPDNSVDVLLDTPINDGDSFYGDHATVQEALYDWYVKEYDLELPLFVEQVSFTGTSGPQTCSMRRYDGNGWYCYISTPGWENVEQEEPFWGKHWEWVSSYGTNSRMIVDTFTMGVADEQVVAQKQGDTPVDEKQMIWQSHENGLESRCYFYKGPEGRSWRVETQWDEAASAQEREALQLMAESFTVDGRFQWVKQDNYSISIQIGRVDTEEYFVIDDTIA